MKYMKKHLLFLSVFLLSCIVGLAQDQELIHKPWSQIHELDPYKVIFKAFDSECYETGAVGFAIVYKNGGGRISAADFESLHLSKFRISHKGIHQDTTMHHTTVNYDPTAEWTTAHMEVGTFDVSMECMIILPNNERWSVVVDSILTVEDRYEEPYFYALTRTSGDGVELGHLHSLSCEPTGRIQLHITGGHFPYRVKMWDEDGNMVRDSLFQGRQNSGTNMNYANYKDFYTFTDVPVGNWQFTFEDACGSERGPIGWIVREEPMPKLKKIQVYAYSGSLYDSNVVKINAILNTQNVYYLNKYASLMEYRFLVPGFQSQSWQPFPNNGTDKVVLSDTVVSAKKYCDLYNRQVAVAFRINEDSPCKWADTLTRFVIKKPIRFNSSLGYENETTPTTIGNPCAAGVYYRHSDHHERWGASFDKGRVTDWDDDQNYTYHFTYPLVWRYVDALTNIPIKTDTIKTNWYSEHTTLNFDDFLAIPALAQTAREQLEAGAFIRSVKVQLVDANGCVLFNENNLPESFEFIREPVETDGPDWTYSSESPECCSKLRTISIQEINGVNFMDYDGVTIELVRSPDDNLYNFKAIYHSTTMTWEVQGKQMNNFADIIGAPNGRSLVFSKVCLPSGHYLFKISNAPCIGEKTLDVYLSGIITAGIAVEPKYKIIEGCNDIYVKFEEGSIATFNNYIAQSDVTNSNPISQPHPLPTLFQIVDGPLGGFDPYDHTIYRLGDSVRIGYPTTEGHPYRVRIFPDQDGFNHNMCGDFADTFDVYYEGKNITYEYSMALLCDENSNKGSVFVKIDGGIPPYTFHLYNRPDKQGPSKEVITNSSEETAVFTDVPMTIDSILSCEVMDHCGQGYYLNFRPELLASLQVTWFDPKVTHTCEGDSVQMFALQVGQIFNYEWKDPNGEVFFSGPSPKVLIERNSPPGQYTVTIKQTGCNYNLYDTVTIKPEKSPAVMLSQYPGSEVCPGEMVQVKFLPESSVEDPTAIISFTVAYENDFGLVLKNYVGHHHEVILDTVIANAYTRIYPVHIEESIGECQYNRADPSDTSYVKIRTDGIDPCKVNTVDALVCQGEDAYLYANCTEPAPLKIRWFSDFELRNMVYEQTVTSTGANSSLLLPHLMSKEIRYVSVAKDHMCPTNNLSVNGKLVMAPGETVDVHCTDALLFFDQGGPDQDYLPGENSNSVYTQMFVCRGAHHNLMLHFVELNISPTSNIMVFSGGRAIADSLIVSINSESEYPDAIVSNCDTLLFYFVPGDISGEGWKAIVKPTPGVAIGDVLPPAVEMHRDWVCQSQTRNYDNDQITNLNIVSQSTLNEAVKRYGTYQFFKNVPSSSGCDSMAYLTLSVEPASLHETTAITTNKTGFTWHTQDGHDTIYYRAGTYVINNTDDEGCDHLEVLRLVVITIENEDKDNCYGDSAVVGISVSTEEPESATNNFIESRHAVGDIYYWNPNFNRYDIMRPDSFLYTTGLFPVGVICYMDNDNVHGRVIALVDACKDEPWAAKKYNTTVVSLTSASGASDWITPRYDMDGSKNTEAIRNSTGWVLDDGFSSDNVNRFKERAPAAYYCYFYDPFYRSTGTVPLGWYMPSSGEFNYCYSNRIIVNKSLAMLSERFGAQTLQGGDDNPDDGYWTSTGGSAKNTAIHINSKGQIHLGHEKERTWKGTKYTRAMFQF